MIMATSFTPCPACNGRTYKVSVFTSIGPLLFRSIPPQGPLRVMDVTV